MRDSGAAVMGQPCPVSGTAQRSVRSSGRRERCPALATCHSSCSARTGGSCPASGTASSLLPSLRSAPWRSRALSLAPRVRYPILVGPYVRAASPRRSVLMDLLRHGGMPMVFSGVRAASTLGMFLRSFTFGHVRQFDAVASRALIGLADTVPGLLAGSDRLVMLDIDDTVKAVFGASKQGAEHGYTPGSRAPERAAGHDQHASGCPGDRGRPVAPRGRVLSSWGGAPDPRRDHHQPPSRGDRPGPGASGHQHPRPGVPPEAAATASPTRTLALGSALASALDSRFQSLTDTLRPSDPRPRRRRTRPAAQQRPPPTSPQGHPRHRPGSPHQTMAPRIEAMRPREVPHTAIGALSGRRTDRDRWQSPETVET